MWEIAYLKCRKLNQLHSPYLTNKTVKLKF